MLKIYCYLFMCLVVPPNVFSAEESNSIELSLDDKYVLKVKRTNINEVSVSIRFSDSDELQKSYTAGNAIFFDDAIQEVEVDKSNDSPEYLITLYDATSNYGAMHGIVIFKDRWWDMVYIPDEKFELRMEVDMNIILIDGQPYIFKDGLFTN